MELNMDKVTFCTSRINKLIKRNEKENSIISNKSMGYEEE